MAGARSADPDAVRPPQPATKGLRETPAALGYSMPAEWERHEATWLAWPHDPLTWPGRVEKVEAAFVAAMKALTPHERVELLVKDEATKRRAREWLAEESVENVRFHDIPTVDSWIRDYGPVFVRRKARGHRELAIVDWVFNAWGGKYESLKADDAVPRPIARELGLPLFAPGIVMEGGSVDVDGEGTLLTTEQCLLNPNRNPHLTRGDIEGYLRDHLGVQKVLWLGEGIEGDDTDGHVDDIARFVAPGKVVAAVEPDERSANHAPLTANLKRLRSMTDAKGRALTVVELPMPEPVVDDEGRPLPASYANFLIANGVVLLPVFGGRCDAKAQRIVEGLFPGRRVVAVRCEDVVWGMGTLHCLSQQQPAC